jgi:hypothetical protein
MARRAAGTWAVVAGGAPGDRDSDYSDAEGEAEADDTHHAPGHPSTALAARAASVLAAEGDNNEGTRDVAAQEPQHPAPPPAPPAVAPASDTGRQCWICFESEADAPASSTADAAWVAPCRCKGDTKWVHQHCLLLWLDEDRAGAAAAAAAAQAGGGGAGRGRAQRPGPWCPQCHWPYAVEEPPPPLWVRVAGQVDRLLRQSTVPALLLGLSGASYVAALAYGVQVVVVVLGPSAAATVLLAQPPGDAADAPLGWRRLVGLPLIPAALTMAAQPGALARLLLPLLPLLVLRRQDWAGVVPGATAASVVVALPWVCLARVRARSKVDKKDDSRARQRGEGVCVCFAVALGIHVGRTDGAALAFWAARMCVVTCAHVPSPDAGAYPCRAPSPHTHTHTHRCRGRGPPTGPP